MPEEIDFPWLENASFGFGDFVPVFQNAARVRQANNDTGEANEVTMVGNEASDSSDPTSSDSTSPHEDCTEASMPKIFSCPEEGCIKSFVHYSSLEKHCIFCAHIRSLEKITLQDRAKLLYAQRLEEGQTKHLSCVQVHGSPSSPLLDMGWALKSKAKVVRFNEKQKSYLESRFLHGEKLGKKESGEAVAKDMRKARDAKNERLFSMEEFLTPQQINLYFSHFGAKRRQLSESEIDAVQSENAVKEVTEDVIVALQQESNKYNHPIVFNEFKLCEMSEDELSMLCLTTLKAISEEFDLQASGW